MPRAPTPDLHDSEQRFATLVDSIKDYAVFMLSPEGIVLTWNQGARRLKGYAPEEIIGQSFERFYTEPDRAAGRPKYLLGLAQAEGRVEDEGWRVRSDGTRFWADVVITALRDQDGKLLGYAKVTRDLTERRQAEQDRAARLAAERAAQRIERLQAATAALAAAIHPESAAEVLADVAVRSLSAASGAVSLAPLDGGAAQLVAVRGDFEGVPTADQPMWRPEEATVPLILDQHILGVMAIRFDPPRPLDPDERGFLLALAEVGAQALDRARLYAAERAARTEAQAAERAAREEAQLVETLHDISLALSAELDLETLVRSVTDAATRVTGKRASFDASSEHKKVVRSDGVVVVPIISRSGEVLGGLSFEQGDASAFSERAERLALGIAAQAAVAIDNARLYQQVQQAVRTRDEFLAAAAHDLKTPLASTKGMAQLLRNRIQRMEIPGGERLTEGLIRIDQSVERMTALIDELLDLGRLQMNRPLDLERQRVDAVELLRQVVADQQPNAPRHVFDIRAPDEPLIGNWDVIRLRRVFDNLVSNAVKYSPDGGEIQVNLERDGDVAIIQVADNGVGIPSDDLPYIFERFRRGGNVAFIHGTGIGLGIAQTIARHHGGSIDVESTEGKGTTFTVRLPLD